MQHRRGNFAVVGLRTYQLAGLFELLCEPDLPDKSGSYVLLRGDGQVRRSNGSHDGDGTGQGKEASARHCFILS